MTTPPPIRRPPPVPGYSLQVPRTDYGIPALRHLNQLTRELYLVRNPTLTDDPGLHLFRAALLAFPLSAYRPSPWTLQRFRSLYKHDFMCWWGPGASGKTTDAAAFALLFWMADPEKTYIPCCSTTVDMLEKRIWGEIKRLFTCLVSQPGFEKYPATLRSADREIEFKVPEEKLKESGQNTKALIRGVAIQQGTVQEALGNVIGVHNKRVLLIVDEAQASREALIEARDNLGHGTDEFKTLLIGNPTSHTDPLGKYSEPDHPKKWEFVEHFEEYPWPFIPRKNPDAWRFITVKRPTVTEWTTKWGGVQVFCGFDSPGIHAPEEFHFLTTARDVNRVLSERAPTDPMFWTQVIGFACPDDPATRIFNPTLFSSKNAHHRGTLWKEHPLRVASIDPSYSNGGDAYLFQPAKAGITVDGRFMIEFDETIAVPLLPDRLEGETVEKARCRYVAKLATDRELTAEQLIFDASMSHHTEVGLIEEAMGTQGIFRYSGQLKASKAVPSVMEPKPADTLYDNMRAECYHIMWFFLQAGQVRGIGDLDIQQFVEIRAKPTARGQRGLLVLESKPDMRLRGVKSPDRADTKAMCAYLLRHRFQCLPGAELPPAMPKTRIPKTGDEFLASFRRATGVKTLPLAKYRRHRS